MRRLLALLIVLPATCALAQVSTNTDVRFGSVRHPVYSTTGIVTARRDIAADVGAQVLADGGNAVDAAVAVGFSLAVTLPRAGNIGGGGFMLVYDSKSGETTVVDYREMAPRAAHRDMFLDADGDADPELSRRSHRAAGVPGTVAGLYLAHQKFGRLPWNRLVQPAVDLARGGIAITHFQQTELTRRRDQMCQNEATCGYFYKPGGVPYSMGELWVQSDLADSLQLIADQGADAFYRGEIAEKIVAEMEAGGGLIDKESLAAYKPVLRKPMRGEYRGYEIVTMPPPSSGGLHIIQMLNILEHFPIASLAWGGVDGIHLLAEVMRLAYADRSKHLADPDFYPVPVEWLTSEEYGVELAASIDMTQARPSSDVAPGVAPAYESPETTHFSIIDRDGNVVSNTYTLNLSYGSKISVSGAGFLLNNEMDDFVSKPGVPNAYGLLGDAANSVEASKRPLSSMSPTIVFANGEPWFAVGGMGGSRIISGVLQTIVNVIDHGMNIADASGQPRMHHQWYPDVLLLEPGFSPDTTRLLKERGHDVRLNRTGTVQIAAYKDGTFRGATDPRMPNSGAVAPVEINANSD